MEKLLNSSVLNRISCHHYKRQIRDKTSGTQTGSLIRRLKYFHPWNILVWQKLFIEFSMRRGRLLFISVFSPRSCLFLSVSCYPETLNNYSFAEDVSWKVTECSRKECSPFFISLWFYLYRVYIIETVSIDDKRERDSVLICILLKGN